MKLKNKKTGEIVIANVTRMVSGVEFDCGQTLAELNEEWEDYKEPKNFYIVEQRGTVGSRFRTGDEYEKMFKSIGNYFETEEEAEKAVEKLKAWKRLKDKGFRFIRYKRIGFGGSPFHIDITASIDGASDTMDKYEEDLQTVFGGEE